QSFSEVQIQFAVDSNAKDDLDAVNQRLAQLQLPEGASKPLAQTFSFSAIPSMTYALAAADGNLSRVTREAKTIIAPALAGATGAAEIKVIGGEQNAITITLDASRLAAQHLSPFRAAPALTGPPAHPPPASLPSLSIKVVRDPSGNAISLSNDIRSRMAKLQLDSNARMSLIEDSATGIRASLNDLLLEGLIGALLAILVIFLFLRSVRATLVTAVSLPTSVLVALLGTNLGGFSLKILTLAGLTIAVGRILDC